MDADRGCSVAPDAPRAFVMRRQSDMHSADEVGSGEGMCSVRAETLAPAGRVATVTAGWEG